MEPSYAAAKKDDDDDSECIRRSEASTLNGSTTWITTSTGEHKPLDTHHATLNARRSGSASVLITNEKGEVTIQRKTTDLTIAIQK
eukprot:scaffold387_cov174-Ochromonas_danica.AAC.1